MSIFKKNRIQQHNYPCKLMNIEHSALWKHSIESGHKLDFENRTKWKILI